MADHTTTPEKMRQEAPWPAELLDLVSNVEGKPGWRFWIGECSRDDGKCWGLTLIITVTGPNSYGPDPGPDPISVAHYFPVPSATYDRRAWQRWLIDCCMSVETHEMMEFFKVEGSRPYAPNHGPGRNPYLIHERGTEEDARTTFRGEKDAFQP